MRSALPIALLLAAAACSDAGGDANQPAVSDSAGIAIVQHTAQGWERAPTWALSAEPIAVIGGEEDATAIDLTNSQVGALLPDGRVLAMSMQPAQLYVFSADGATPGLLGRGGEGPGEYRFLSAVLTLGGDTVAGYDLFKRKALLFDAGGESLGAIDFPMTGTPIPPLLMGRLTDGTWVFQTINPLAEPPEGSSGVYRQDTPVLTWRDGGEALDTSFTVLGPMLEQGTITAGGQSMTMGRGIGFGANSFVGGSQDMIWSTTGDKFTIVGHDATGALKREIRVSLPAVPVSEADKEQFKGVLREALEQARSMAPADMIEAELEKVERTTFAQMRPGIGQMLVDRMGRVWATPGLPQVDSTVTWGVFDREGGLLGKVVLPGGTLFAASEDRIVVRREDDETGLIRLEVWGVQRDQ
jgi:hypothetical protein